MSGATALPDAADGGVGDADSDTPGTPAHADRVAELSLPETPEQRTAANRWAAGKAKVLALVGSPSCLLTGHTYFAFLLHLIHIIPRTLWKTHKRLFILLQNDIGIVVWSKDRKHFRRILNLDSSRNMDIMNVLFHKLFDGPSVLKGLGSGVIFLVPEDLDECLRIIVEGRAKRLDYRQMFPKLTYRYKVYVFSGLHNIIVNRVGPSLRSYAHIDTKKLTDMQLLAGDDDDADATRGADDDDDATAQASQEIGPDDIPSHCRPPLEDADEESTHKLMANAPMTVVTHGCPTHFLWDTTFRLWIRATEEEKLAELEAEGKGKSKAKAKKTVTRKFPPMSPQELALYSKLWTDLHTWFNPPDAAAEEELEEQIAQDTFKGPVRHSSRLAGLQTELLSIPASSARPKPRLAQTTDAPAGSSRVAPLHDRHPRTHAEAFEAPESQAGLSTTAGNDPRPRKKKRRLADDSIR
ncbi:hypothetical protein HDZ31DRAFT_37445 [Schizophyllum fasciatum]